MLDGMRQFAEKEYKSYTESFLFSPASSFADAPSKLEDHILVPSAPETTLAL